MSSPRYDWWPYVKGMIRRYPELCARSADLHSTSLSPDMSGMPRGSGSTSDPTARAALRQLPEINQREMAAVRQAIVDTSQLPHGEERIRLVHMVFWSRTHTVWGAAAALQVSERTAQAWHGDFIRAVAKNFGLLDDIAYKSHNHVL